MQQKSWEWFQARAGKVTGSELRNLITDKGTIRDWKSGMPNSYLHLKLAEKWRGKPLETFMGSRQTDQGNLWEDRARSYFASLLDREIKQVGGIESDDHLLWCSPDGIMAETAGLELKCPNADTHVGWLLAGDQVPKEHVLQVQFGLYVTGWSEWVFGSFVSDMPHLLLTVKPTPRLLYTIEKAVAEFQARFSIAWQMLCDLNGGPPPEPTKFVPTPGPVRFSWEQQSESTQPSEDLLV